MLASLAFVFSVVNGHGRLLVPATRKPTGYENDPVSGNTGSDFVCRNAVTAPATTVTAGQPLTVKWVNTAKHVGDCALYVSYDWDAANNGDMQFFKIANWQDCKSLSGLEHTITVPDWLPAGRAVIRWDWYALHVFPTIEFYAQCSDVTIVNNGNAAQLTDIVKYSIINPPIMPARGDSAGTVGFRNEFGNGEQYMTGPQCAMGSSLNNCAFTAKGTTGWVDVGDNTAQQPVQQPTEMPDSTTLPAPVPTTTAPGQATAPVATETTDAATTPGAPVYPGNGKCQKHTVNSGETLSVIATYYTSQGAAVTWEQICETNFLQNCALIQPGQTLLIPCQGCGTYSRGGIELYQTGDDFLYKVNMQCTSQ